MPMSVRTYLHASHRTTSDYYHIAFLSPEGTGYSQHLFSAGCQSCKFTVTREALAVLKFARDVVLDPANPADVQTYEKGVYLP